MRQPHQPGPEKMTTLTRKIEANPLQKIRLRATICGGMRSTFVEVEQHDDADRARLKTGFSRSES